MKVAFITGISGQDGSYLTEFLLQKDYQVWGIIRKTSANNKYPNIQRVMNHPNLTLKYGDLSDSTGLIHILQQIHTAYPHLERLEFYNLGAISHVKISFDIPEHCTDITGKGVLHCLEAIRLSGYSEKIRFYQASTSELYGKVLETPQTEKTPFYPRSPYAIAKLYAFWMCKNYREAYGLYTCNGILFNHESPRRDNTFVTRKITEGLADICIGTKDRLLLGNLNASRDWGHARDYVQGIWAMMQLDTPDDYILCTNETHTVREFVEKAFALRGFTIAWKGEGINEIGYDVETGRDLIFVDTEFFRPTEVDHLLGDCTKAAQAFGWSTTTTFEQLVQEMVDNDYPG